MQSEDNDHHTETRTTGMDGQLLCGHRRPHHAKGLCRSCYLKDRGVAQKETRRKKDRDWTNPPMVREINKLVRDNPNVKPLPDAWVMPIISRYSR